VVLALALAALLAAPPAAAEPAFSVVTVAKQALAERIVALAWIDDARLILLTPEEALLCRTGETGVTILTRMALPGPRRAARAPAGLVFVDADAETAWVMSNRRAGAALLEWSGDRLALRAEAEALPLQGSATGLRYREGMDWIEGDLPSLGAGPFLGVAPTGEMAVSPDGRLLSPQPAIERTTPAAGPAATGGPALAPLWPGWVAVSSNRPPGEGDTVVIVRTGPKVRLETAIVSDEPVRALASRPSGPTFRLAVAEEEGEGRSRLLLVEIRRGER
jgi:hypothetical protein